MDNERKRQTFPWLQVAGIIVVVFVVGLIILPALIRPSVSGWRRPAEQNYLKQLGIVFKMYSGENDNMFPPVAPYPDVYMFNIQSVYPEYLSDLSILASPYLPDAGKVAEEMNTLATQRPTDWEAITRLAAKSFSYTGWVVHDASEMEQLISARRGLDSSQLDEDIEFNGKKFHRLKEGVEDHFITGTIDPNSSAKAQSLIPVMIGNQTSSEQKDRRNVLFMDGHVESRKDFSKIPAIIN